MMKCYKHKEDDKFILMAYLNKSSPLSLQINNLTDIRSSNFVIAGFGDAYLKGYVFVSDFPSLEPFINYYKHNHPELCL